MNVLLRIPVILLAAMLAGGCSRTDQPDGTESGTLRLGYFPNITHSQALIGLARGDFQKALGPNVTLKAIVFNAGPSAIEALFAGQLDLAYIGPNPAINGFVQSRGRALRIIAGATSAGAALVVRREAGILKPSDLARKRISSPQLGNTQDVALRNYLISQGLNLAERGGNVLVLPTQNPQILDLFRRGEIDGAWVPEPWASRLIVEGNGILFLDERDLWPNGDFVTAHIIAATEMIARRPELIKACLRAHVDVTRWELERPEEARRLINAEIERLIGKKLDERVLSSSWLRLRPTWDPIASSLIKSADAAYAAGYLKIRPDLSEIYDLRLLNSVLRETGLAEVR